MITRFAPSPTGYLHLGHAYSALLAYQTAIKNGGTFVLRIEDIDSTRCRPDFTDAVFQDLSWLGLKWAQPVRRQSCHMADYAIILDQLRQRNLLYPCFCTRKELHDQAIRSATAPHETDAPIIYSGACRHLSPMERADKMATTQTIAWRLDCAAALGECGTLTWHDRGQGRVTAQPQIFGDVVLARKDCAASYHLCVTIDDALQGITLVTRGHDLFHSTHIHRLLQALLGFPTPDYAHHPLLLGKDGKRFAKRNDAVTLRSLRQAGYTADNIYTMIQEHAQISRSSLADIF